MKVPKSNPLKESFIPMSDQIKDITDQVKLNTLEGKANKYAEDMTDWLRTTDLDGNWAEDSLKATAIFFKVAYKAGFKEAMR